MATVTANQTFRGQGFAEDGTVTVKGRGECFVKVVGNTWSGTLTALDDQAEEGTFAASVVDGTAISLDAGIRSYHIKAHPSDQWSLRLSLTGATSPDIDCYVSFEFPPAI